MFKYVITIHITQLAALAEYLMILEWVNPNCISQLTTHDPDYLCSKLVCNEESKRDRPKVLYYFFADWSSLSFYLTSTKARQEASKAIMKIDKVLVRQKSPPLWTWTYYDFDHLLAFRSFLNSTEGVRGRKKLNKGHYCKFFFMNKEWMLKK